MHCRHMTCHQCSDTKTERLRAELLEAIEILRTVKNYYDDGEVPPPDLIDIGIGCWLARNDPDGEDEDE